MRVPIPVVPYEAGIDFGDEPAGLPILKPDETNHDELGPPAAGGPASDEGAAGLEMSLLGIAYIQRFLRVAQDGPEVVPERYISDGFEPLGQPCKMVGIQIQDFAIVQQAGNNSQVRFEESQAFFYDAAAGRDGLVQIFRVLNLQLPGHLPEGEDKKGRNRQQRAGHEHQKYAPGEFAAEKRPFELHACQR